MTKIRLSDEQRRRDFFYAEAAAGMYDETIEWVGPYYNLLHETIIDLLKYHYQMKSGSPKEQVEGWLLDVGAGTGTESIRILKEFPNVNIVAVDLCQPMLEQFRKNFKEKLPGEDINERCKLVDADILGEKTTKDFLLSFLPKDQRYIAVISVFTIHHFNTKDKEEVYKLLFNVLKNGGIFINGDLFKYNSGNLTKYSNHFDLAWIDKNFHDKNLPFNGLEEQREKLCNLWKEHYQNVNDLDPLEAQSQMLNKVGFTQAGCPFRYWQMGILYGYKDKNEPGKQKRRRF